MHRLFSGIRLASLFTFPILSQGITANESFFEETLYSDWKQKAKIDKVILQEKTEHQDLLIFENVRFGRVLTLDGIIQLTEADECVYHEMMVHVPLISHGNAKKILIIGGGDGGILREVVRHKNVEKVVLVEIDRSVIDMSKKHLPKISNGAFNDPRLELIIADGSQFVKETQEHFDVIICDSSDPVGPSAVLFTQEFYGDCKAILNPKGIFVNMNGVAFMQPDVVRNTFERRRPFFKDNSFYVAPVPTYVGGFLTMGWATDELDYRNLRIEEIKKRIDDIEGELKYYNEEIHLACFALPRFIKNIFSKE